ncbi:MAG: PDZ domain-containing protein [Cyclobacteriaceae bacterium]|nr:PDZ domain-containing protein [Cyclobacteriaceae bacterium SS2]
MKSPLSLLFTAFVLLSQAQTPITTIPFELYGDHIIIKASVDDSRPLDFIFDSGSGFTVIDEDISRELGLSGKKIQMNEPATVLELIKHNKLAINHFPMEKNIKVYSTDLDHLEISLGRDIDGILGYDLLHHHTIHLNYEKQTMDIYDHGKGPKNGDAIPFELNTAIPVVKGSVMLNNSELHAANFYVITGAGTTLDFNSPYAKKYDVIHKTGKHYSYPVKGIGQDENLHYEGHVLSVSFGKQLIEDLPIGISTAKSGIQASESVAGILGNQVLSMYNITFDIPGKMLYFEKNSNFGKELAVNCSGIDLQLSPDKQRLLVHQVFEDSPAAEAGIKLNDELLSVNNKPVSELHLPDIKEMLRQEGETVKLVLSDNGKEKSVSFKLKSLLE